MSSQPPPWGGASGESFRGQKGVVKNAKFSPNGAQVDPLSEQVQCLTILSEITFD